MRSKSFSPDEELALLPGSLAPRQQEHLAHLACFMPFDKAAQMIEELLAVQTNEETVRQLTERIYGFGLVDWRDGWFDGRIATGRTADVFCEQVRAAVARSRARGRVAIIIADNLKTHTAPGSLLVRSMLSELSDQLSLVYTPAYDPDANRIEWRCAHLTPHRHS
jgi:DDE superfamily endonuclease